MINKSLLKKILLFFLLSLGAYFNLGYCSQQPRERIVYAISPVGVSIYEDMGEVELNGQKRNLVIFKTDVAGFHDTEKIYSDTNTGYPLWIERYIVKWFGKEFLTEEYFPRQCRVDIIKYVEGKKVDEYVFKGSGPIHNAVLLPFSVSKNPDLKIGWSTLIRMPKEFKVALDSIEKVSVPAGTFEAFHFTSQPSGFEIWISTDKERIPVKIKGVGFPYTLVMKERTVK